MIFPSFSFIERNSNIIFSKGSKIINSVAAASDRANIFQDSNTRYQYPQNIYKLNYNIYSTAVRELYNY
jgi:hypothetical protein